MVVTLKSQEEASSWLFRRVEARAANPQLDTPYSGLAGASTIVMGGVENPIGEVAVDAVDHSAEAATARNILDDGPVCSTARTRIPALACPSENDCSDPCHAIKSLTTCVRSRLLLTQAADSAPRPSAEITKPHLIIRTRAMFSGGRPGSGPVASGSDLVASEPSDGLLVDAVDAIKDVMKLCVRKGMRKCGAECAVHVQCEVLDKEEMLGYLLADVFGRSLLPQKDARPVGEAARLRATKVGPAIAAGQRRVEKAAVGSAAPAEELETLRNRVVVELPLPSQRQCDGSAAAAASKMRKLLAAAGQPLPPTASPQFTAAEQERAQWRVTAQDRMQEVTPLLEAMLDFQRTDRIVDLEATGYGVCQPSADTPVPRACYDGALQRWCWQHGEPIRTLEYRRNRKRLSRAVHARRMRPQNAEERAALDRRIRREEQENDLCLCATKRVPSWLCPVAACWATAAGSPCGLRDPCGGPCDCMAAVWHMKADEWLPEERPLFLVGPRAHVSAMSREADLKFPWLDRTPGGRYGPGFCPERAGELLTPIELEMVGTEQGYDMLLRDYPNFGL